ncbi:MAG: ribonuclease P protein component [Clostridiales bacterium]|nr:ribonuclease P protein component [Clostridiales bacterium]
MQKSYRLQKNKQFQYVYRHGKNTVSRHLVLIYLPNKQLKIGFSVSKKVGNAVVRNKIKRRLREGIRPVLPILKSGHYVIIARVSSSSASFQQLEKDLMYLLKKQSLFVSKEASFIHD